MRSSRIKYITENFRNSNNTFPVPWQQVVILWRKEQNPLRSPLIPPIESTTTQRHTHNATNHRFLLLSPTDPNTATPIHLSKPTISGTEPPEQTLMLWCAYSPTKHHKQPHRNDIGVHTGRRSNTKRRASHQQMVIYLLDHGLTQHETNILSKGLKFVPTPTTVNRTELTVDVKKWSHRMRLKEFYWDTRNTQQTY